MPDKPAAAHRAAGTMRISGIHSILSFLAENRVHRLYALPDGGTRVQALCRRAQDAGVPVITKSRRDLTALADDQQHQGVVAEAVLPQPALTPLIDSGQRLVILDGVTDPRNLGAIMRVVRAFGGGAVIAPARRSAPLSAAAVRAAAGAAAQVALVRVPNLARLLRTLDSAERTIIAADEHSSVPLFSRSYPPATCWVFGDEGSGIRRLVREHCHDSVRIPTVAGAGGCLNVVTACAICLAAAAPSVIAV